MAVKSYILGFKLKRYPIQKLICEHLGLKICWCWKDNCTHTGDCHPSDYGCHTIDFCICDEYINYICQQGHLKDLQALFPGLPKELKLIEYYVHNDWDFYMGVTRKENNIHLEDNEKQAFDEFRNKYSELLQRPYISMEFVDE